MILAFYVLLADKKGGGKGKGQPAQVETATEAESSFDGELSPEYIPQDVTIFSNEYKLKDDLAYREQKLEYQIEQEREAFNATHDEMGKDHEKFKALNAKHRKARDEFGQKRKEAILKFRNQIEETRPTDNGLR